MKFISPLFWWNLSFVYERHGCSFRFILHNLEYYHSKLSRDNTGGQFWRERGLGAVISVKLHGNFVNYLNVPQRTHISSKSSITGYKYPYESLCHPSTCNSAKLSPEFDKSSILFFYLEQTTVRGHPPDWESALASRDKFICLHAVSFLPGTTF